MNLNELLKAEIAEKPVTEWTGTIGGETVTLVSDPLTAADMEAIRRKFPDFMSNPSVGGMVALIVRKTRTSDGKKAFGPKDEPLLLQFPLPKIGEIFGALYNEMFDEITGDEDERVKNSESDPND